MTILCLTEVKIEGDLRYGCGRSLALAKLEMRSSWRQSPPILPGVSPSHLALFAPQTQTLETASSCGEKLLVNLQDFRDEVAE